MILIKKQKRVVWYYPGCEQSRMLFKLFKRTALKPKEVELLIKAGFNIERVE